MIHSSTAPATVFTRDQKLERITFYNEGPGTASVLLGGSPVSADNFTFKLAPGEFREIRGLSADVSVMVSANGTNLSCQGLNFEGNAV